MNLLHGYTQGQWNLPSFAVQKGCLWMKLEKTRDAVLDICFSSQNKREKGKEMRSQVKGNFKTSQPNIMSRSCLNPSHPHCVENDADHLQSRQTGGSHWSDFFLVHQQWRLASPILAGGKQLSPWFKQFSGKVPQHQTQCVARWTFKGNMDVEPCVSHSYTHPAELSVWRICAPCPETAAKIPCSSNDLLALSNIGCLDQSFQPSASSVVHVFILLYYALISKPLCLPLPFSLLLPLSFFLSSWKRLFGGRHLKQ